MIEETAEMIHQLTYISTAARDRTEGDLDAILDVSRRNNRRDGITGILISDSRRFLQALEGEEAVVDAAYARIKGDPRHRAAVMLSRRTIPSREFGSWDMAFQRVISRPGCSSIVEQVDALVADVPDPNTRALFSSFIRLPRPAAA